MIYYAKHITFCIGFKWVDSFIASFIWKNGQEVLNGNLISVNDGALTFKLFLALFTTYRERNWLCNVIGQWLRDWYFNKIFKLCILQCLEIFLQLQI